MVKTLEHGGSMRDAGQEYRRGVSASEAAPDRLERVLAAVEDRGSAVLLLGEPGSGKTRLAEEAALALEERGEGGAAVFVLPTPPLDPVASDDAFWAQLVETFGVIPPDPIADEAQAPTTSELARAALASVLDEVGDRVPVIVAHAVDRYPRRAEMLLAALVRSRRLRLIATARHLVGAAERLSRDPRMRRLSIGPLTYAEASAVLVKLLGGEQIEFATLRRWYAITNGNAHSLTVLALALDRRGLIRRERGMIWETAEAGGVPEEFLAHLDETCSPEEFETLEIVALAEPLSESVLLERLLPEHLESLQSAGLIVPRTMPKGETALTTSHELLTASLIERMGSERRRQISQDLFLALRHDLQGQDPIRHPNRLVRLVMLGLGAGRTLPLDWLIAALDHLTSEHALLLRMRVALAIVAHIDASPFNLAIAAINASQAARLLGNRGALFETAEAIHALLGREQILRSFPPSLRIGLQLERITHLTLDLEQYDAALRLLTSLEEEPFEPGSAEHEMLRCARALLLARTGQLRRAGLEAPGVNELGRMQLEWVRSQTRVVSSLVLTQQGRFAEAVRVAEKARVFAVLGDRAEQHIADQLTLSLFIAQCAAGSTLAAGETIRQLQEQAINRLHDTGFVEAGLAMLAITEGRWREAAQLASRAWDRYSKDDCYGISGVMSATLAFALAALGERSESRRAVVTAELPRPGVRQTLRGLVHLLTLGARHWNGEPDTATQAKKVIAWAASEDLPLIELRAYQTLAVVQKRLEAAQLARVRELAPQIDEPMGGALLAFFEETQSGEAAWDAPATRVLAELGVWIPLPRTGLLSAREREIALHAALGYSSKWIADRFFLSTRTVETHLRHVFTKLGVAGRDELRAQFRDGRLSA